MPALRKWLYAMKRGWRGRIGATKGVCQRLLHRPACWGCSRSGRAAVIIVVVAFNFRAVDRDQQFRASPRSVEASPMRSGDAGDTTEVRPRVP
jgi:hypothetical protein